MKHPSSRLACIGILLAAWAFAALAGETQYTYDELGRLTRVVRPDCTVTTYTYDAVGNRKSKIVVVDQDCDTVRDTLDCAPADPGAHTFPGEASGVLFAADAVTLSWDSVLPGAGTDSVHDVLRGFASELGQPTRPSDTCLTGTGTGSSSTTDIEEPATGFILFYLVRGRNVCATGTYGTTSEPAERTGTACPQ